MYFVFGVGFGFGLVASQINLSTRGNKQRLPKMMFSILPSSDLIHIYGNFDLLPIILK
jgi:hypothetical protein